MSDIRQKKLDFAKLAPIQALATVRCGFELETQAVDGKDYDELRLGDDDNEDRFDADAYACARSDAINNALSSLDFSNTFLDVLNGATTYRVGDYSVRSTNIKETVQKICTTFQEQYAWAEQAETYEAYLSDYEVTWDEVNDLEGVRNALHDFQEFIADEATDHISPSDFAVPREESDFNLPNGLQAKHDGSVRGPEIIVAGNGTTASKFSALLSQLTTEFDLEVDTGCSFHIHVSVPGITHTYGEKLQLYMMEYILRNIHRVPECVKDRWNYDTRYFKPHISREKFSFVHHHSRCNTWEFRCFGNIDSHADGMRCLQLAVEAMQFAYSVDLGLKESLFKSPSDWNRGYLERVLEGISLAAAVRADRREAHHAAQRAA